MVFQFFKKLIKYYVDKLVTLDAYAKIQFRTR